MSIVSCPQCGAQYSLAGLTGVDTIVCPPCDLMLSVTTPASPTAPPLSSGFLPAASEDIGFTPLTAPMPTTEPATEPERSGLESANASTLGFTARQDLKAPAPSPYTAPPGGFLGAAAGPPVADSTPAPTPAPTPASAEPEVDLELAEWVTCGHCRQEYYPSELPELDDQGVRRCRRCRRPLFGEDAASEAPSSVGKRIRPQKGRTPKAPARGRPAKLRSSSSDERRRAPPSASKPSPSTTSKPGPRKLVISEQIKDRILEALAAGKAKEAFQLSFSVAGRKFDDAKRVFDFVQKEALKTGLIAKPFQITPASPKKMDTAGSPPLKQTPPEHASAPPASASTIPIAPPASPQAPPDPEEQGFLHRVSFDGRLAHAELLCKHERFAAARALAGLVASRAPQNTRALLCLAEASHGLGQEDQAFDAARQAAQLAPRDPKVIRSYARSLARRGALGDACKAFSNIAGLGFGEIQDAVALAELCGRLGDQDNQRRLMQDVLGRAPHSLEPQRELAMQLIERGEHGRAATLLEELLDQEQTPYASSLAVAEKLRDCASEHRGACRAAARVLRRAGRSIDALRVLIPHAAERSDAGLQNELGTIYLLEGSDALALEHLERSHASDPAEVANALELGRLQLRLGRPREACDSLRSSVATRPDNAALHLLLAESHSKLGEAAHASRLLAQARQLASDDAALQGQIDALHRQTVNDRVRSLRQALLENPEHSETQLNLAQALLDKGEPGEALEKLRAARRDPYLLPRVIELATMLRPALSAPREATLLLSELYLETRDLPRAIGCLEAELEVADDPELELQLARLYLTAGRPSAATASVISLLEGRSRSQLRETLQLGQELLGGAHERGDLHLSMARAQAREGDAPLALDAYEGYLSREPEDLEVRREAAQLATDHQQPKRALEFLRPLYDSEHSEPRDFRLMAELCRGQGLEARALELLEKAREQTPDDPELRLEIRETEKRLTELQLSELQRLLDGQPGSDEQRRMLASLLVETERREQAIEVLRSLGNKGEPEVMYHRFAAEHFARRGRLRRAEESLRAMARQLQFEPGSEGNKSMLYRVGTLYSQSGDWQGARRALLELFSSDMSYRDVAEQLQRLSGPHGAPSESDSGASEALLEQLANHGALNLDTIFESLAKAEVALAPQLLASIRAAAPGATRTAKAAAAPTATRPAVSPPPRAPAPTSASLDTDALLDIGSLPDLDALDSLAPLPSSPQGHGSPLNRGPWSASPPPGAAALPPAPTSFASGPHERGPRPGAGRRPPSAPPQPAPINVNPATRDAIPSPPGGWAATPPPFAASPDRAGPPTSPWAHPGTPGSAPPPPPPWAPRATPLQASPGAPPDPPPREDEIETQRPPPPSGPGP